MKRRIGNLRGKPIIEGDENLMTQNELHEDNLNSNSDSNSGGSNGGSSLEGLLENAYQMMVINYDVWDATPWDNSGKARLPRNLVTNIRDYMGEDVGSPLSYIYGKTNVFEEGTFEAIHPMYFIKDGVCERVESVTVSSRLNTADYATYYTREIYTKSYIFSIEDDLYEIDFYCSKRQ